MKKTVAVVFGGKSAEHDVSIITAHIPIIEALKASGKFEPVPIYIAKDGSWYSDPAMNDLEFFRGPDFEERLARLKKILLLFKGGLQIVTPGLRPKTIAIDVVFPAMHGTFGEDGSLMGLLRMAGTPFVGCDLFASAVAMDKALTKQVLAAEGVPVVPYVWFTKHQWEGERAAINEKISELHWPLFVKPVHLGSSIGISKVNGYPELENAIEVAFHYDDKTLVEESVGNLIEVTLPIMGNEKLEFAGIERALNKTELFDFNEKYLSGAKKTGGVNSAYSEIPANIGDQLTERVKELGGATYRILGCSGIARVDFLINSGTNQVYVNEVNTLPGSLYHHNWKKSGVSSVELITRLIALAEERFRAGERTTRTFQSEILNKVRGPKLQ